MKYSIPIHTVFNEVKENCIKYFQNNRKLDYNFEIGEQCLLGNNFLKVNQKNKLGYYYIIKNKVKKNKSLYKICVKICIGLGGGNYIIEKLYDYKDYKLLKNDKYEVSMNLLRKCDC